MTAATLLSCDPMTIMGSGLSLLVYAIGIHGAQKRKHRALFVYGAVSLAQLVMSAVAVAFVAGFVLFGGARFGRPQAQHHGDAGMLVAMGQHAHANMYDLMQKSGVVTAVPAFTQEQASTLDSVHVDAGDGVEYDLVQVAQPKKAKIQSLVFPNKIQSLVFPRKASVNGVVVNADKPVAPVAKTEDSSSDSDASDSSSSSSSDADSSSDNADNSNDLSGDVEDEEYEVRVTPFGYAVISLAVVIGLVMLVFKVKSIRLAFQMRRMLLAATPSLPTRNPNVQLATPPTAAPASNVRPPTGPAPTMRRDCSRCTYVNAVGAVRCAMCDAALPIVAAVASAPVPRVYVPGSLYPLNTPLN